MRLRIKVLLISTVLVFSLLPAAPAWAACGDNSVTRTYNGSNVGGFFMGSSHPKQNVGCFDGNVRYSSHSANHRGQWFSDTGVWQWSSVGTVWVSSGTQSPVKKLIAGPISVNRPLRIGSTVYDSIGRWWF
jgi:hypothetical protein